MAPRIARPEVNEMPTVKDILARKGSHVCTTRPETNVLEATRLMNANRIGALLVIDDDRIAGIFTERDVLTRVVAAGRDPRVTAVAEVMTTPVAYCTPEAPFEECRGIFTEKRIRHLPVMNGKTLAGIVTSGDLLAYEVSDRERIICYLEEYIRTP